MVVIQYVRNGLPAFIMWGVTLPEGGGVLLCASNRVTNWKITHDGIDGRTELDTVLYGYVIAYGDNFGHAFERLKQLFDPFAQSEESGE